MRVVGDASPIVCTTDDPAEAVERIVPRRNLLVENGDIFISRAASTLRTSHEREVYLLSRQGMGPVSGRFTSFENAVAAGDDLATRHEVRLYFVDAPGEPPQLLKDCRRSSAI